MASKPSNTTCEYCGEAFGCGAKLDVCWCTELTPTEPQAEDIKARFSDCLCPDCLAKLASNANTK